MKKIKTKGDSISKNKVRIICKVLKIGTTSYYKYLKEDVKIIKFLQKFDAEELNILLKEGVLPSVDFSMELMNEISESQKYKILENSKEFSKTNSYFIVFYFDFLCELKKAIQGQSKIDDITFSSSFYASEFNNIFLTYFNYFNLTRSNTKTKKELLLKTNIIYQNSKVFFKNWDKNTLYFLYFSLKNNFKNLYDLKDDNFFKKIIIWHIVGLNVFNLDLSDELKIKKIDEHMSKFDKLKSSDKVLNSLELILKKIDITIES